MPKSAHLLEVGDELEPLEFEVTPELNEQYLYGEIDYHPRYHKESEFGGPIAHPALLLNMSNSTRSPSWYLDPKYGSLHSRDETEFCNPGFVGKRFRVTWKVVDKYEKRGRTYHIREAVVVDEDGVTILKRRIHSTFTSR